jgi:hypothetical protein
MGNNELMKIEEITGLAKLFCDSGLFPDMKSMSQAAVKILAGQELGIGPFESMQGLDIVKGKITMNANLLARQLKRGGKYNYRVVTQTDTLCEVAFFEEGKEVGRASFSSDDATRAGLAGKDNWRQYPSDMLFARAMSRGIRRFAPDAMNATVYTTGEIPGDVQVEVTTGEIIEGEVLKSEPVDAMSETADQRRCHIAGSAKGLTKEGFAEMLSGWTGGKTRSTKTLKKSECGFLIEEINSLDDNAVIAFNEIGKATAKEAKDLALNGE